MAILSNINGKFAVESSGAIQLSGSAGTSGYVLKSNGTGSAASWVDPTTIIGGPYLPLSGGTLTGATATASNIAFTVGGNFTVNGSSFLETTDIVGGSAYPLQITSTQRYMVQVRNLNNTVSSNYGWWWFMDTNFNMGFHADGASDRLTLTRDGDLSVGGFITTPAQERISVGTWDNSAFTGGNAQGFSVQGVTPGLFILETDQTNKKSYLAMSGGGMYLGGSINFLGIDTDGARAVTIDDSQRVGIGDTSPAKPLVVYSAAPPGGITIKAQSGNSSNWIQNVSTGSSWQIGSTSDGWQLYNDNTSAYRVTVQNSGNVGIGTTSPVSKLHVVGEARVYTGSSLGYWGVDAGNSYVYFGTNTSNYGLSFQTSGSQRMRIDSGGSIIIGDGATSGTPASDYRSLEIGRQGNTITGAPWKSNLYFSTNATVTAGSTAFTYRYASAAPTQMTMENGVFTWSNAAAGTVGNTISFTERMRITSDGMVGIGMTPGTAGSSTYMLQMYNSGSQCFLAIGNGTSGNGPTNGLVIGNDANNAYVLNREATTLKFGTNDLERMFIDSSGNVGIGVTSPSQSLEISGNMAIRDTHKIYFNHNTNTNRYIGASSANDLDIAADDDINYRSNYNRFFNGGTEFARLSGSTNSWIGNGSNGQLGIGKTNPAYALDVNGGIASTGTNVSFATAPLSWQANGNTGTYTQTVIYANQSNSSGIINNAAVFIERGRLTNSASGEIRHLIIGSRGGQSQFTFASEKLGINNDSPSAQLHLTANASNSVPFKLQGHNSTSVEQMLIYTGQSAGTGWYNIVAQAGGINQLIIYGNGNIQNANNSYGQISDERLKENIVDTTPKLEDIKKIKVKNFNFIGDDLKQIGMIAQEVEEVFPGLVEEIKQPDVEDVEGGTYKSIKYSVLVPILIKAIQELEVRVKELENK